MRIKKATNIHRTPKYDNKSEKVFSYYSASRKQLTNFERNVSTNGKKINWLGLNKIFRLAGILIILAAISFLTYLNNEPVIKINGTQYRSPALYKNISRQILLDDIRNKTKVFLQTNKISQNIMQQITESSSVTVSSSFLGHSPIITITTNKPLAIYQQKGAPNYIIDTTGKLIINLSDASKYYTDLPVILNDTGLNNRAGDQVMAPSQAFALKQLLVQYAAENKFPKLLMPNVTNEIDVQETGKGYFVKYSLDTTINSQFGAMKATEKKLSELSQVPTSYIDIRLSDKAFLK